MGWDPWRVPSFLLWMILFAAGFGPDYVFAALRDAGGVVPQRALINSPYLITLALTGYVVGFVYFQRTTAAASPAEAWDAAILFGILALVAFVPVDFTAVILNSGNELISRWDLIQNYVTSAAKLACWWYLLSVFVRYYLLGMDDAFGRIGPVFPSTRRIKHAGVEAGHSNSRRTDALHSDTNDDEPPPSLAKAPSRTAAPPNDEASCRDDHANA